MRFGKTAKDSSELVLLTAVSVHLYENLYSHFNLGSFDTPFDVHVSKTGYSFCSSNTECVLIYQPRQMSALQLLACQDRNYS